ncbi:hypothetical protein MBLNU457_1936t1 [Dothideomycetes sp. NU457]
MSGLTFSLGGSSTAVKPKTQAPLTNQSNGIKRPHAALHDESDSDDENKRKQTVTHFDSSGAVNVHRPKVEKKALVIQPQANRDWKEASRNNANQRSRRAGQSTEQSLSLAEREAQIRAIEDSNRPVYGLNTFERNEDDDANGAPEQQATSQPEEATTAEPTRPKTDDERALEALLGRQPESDLMIPAAATTEEEAFQRDFRSAPDMATLDQYKAVPVEEFGAALLRGMGWKEGQGIGNQKGKKLVKETQPERRPALLGIGAKADAAVAEEMGAWGKGTKKRRENVVYNPVVMRNKKTGEELTEAELEERVKEQKYEDLDRKAEWERKQRDAEKEAERARERRKRYDDSDEGYESKRRERRRERDREDERRSSRRERSRDRERHRHRSRDSDDRRDRDRRRDRDDRDRDQHRSRRGYDREDRDRDSGRYRR